MAAGFPAVVPSSGEDEFGFVLDGGLGVDEVGGVGEPFVGAGEDLAAESCGGEVWKCVRLLLLGADKAQRDSV